jgi:hypothetical protein
MTRAGGADDWSALSDEELLELRPGQLGLRLRGSPLERSVRRLRRELAERGLSFRPHCWLSTDWFSPSGVPGIAIPFFLAHPRLRELEQRHMDEVEGGTEEWCLQLLRHEAGHAFDTAYRLHLRKSWRETFGRFSEPYEPTYRADPASREHVHNLDSWYAQSHPAEDWAETFAVWLDPSSDWREAYAGWPALEKLEYVDRVFTEVGAAPPRVECRERTEHVGIMRQTLRGFYARRTARYPGRRRGIFDGELRGLFERGAPSRDPRPSASAWLEAAAPEIARRALARVAEPRYSLDQVLREMVQRSRHLCLVLGAGPEPLDDTVGSVLRSLRLLHDSRPLLYR